MNRNLTAGVMLMLSFILFPVSPLRAHEEGHSPGKKLFTKHFEDSLFDVTEKASFSVEVLLDDREYDIGRDVVGIVLHDEHDQDVAGAEFKISIAGHDPEQTDAVPVQITDRQNGLYIISGLDLQKKGSWDLVIDIVRGQSRDRVKFAFPEVLKSRHPRGKYSP